MNKIILNMFTSIFSNPVTIIFLIIIFIYFIFKILENRSLYYFLNDSLREINTDYRRSRMYTQIKNKYDNYKTDISYADIEIISFIEEITSELSYKNKFILDRIRGIKNSSSTCILFGVLGTFVGLSMMLLSIDMKDLINSLPVTISSMQTAFITSIFGIISSILINLFIRLQDCEHILLQLMLKLENLLTAEITHNKSKIVDTKIEDVKNTIKQISKSIESIERFDKISKDLNEFNNEFIAAVEVLKGLLDGSLTSIKSFDQGVRRLDKQFNIMNLRFNKLFDKYDNQDDVNKEILLDIKESSKNIVESTQNQLKTKEYLKNINAGFALYERNAQDLLTKLVQHESESLTTSRELIEEKSELNNNIKELSNIMNTLNNDLQNNFDLVFNYIDIYKEAVNTPLEEIELSELKLNLEDSLINNKEKYDKEEIYEVEKEENQNDEYNFVYHSIRNAGESKEND